jgi:hydroxyacylglutathione hydrolase
MAVNVVAVESMPFAENSYVLWPAGGAQAVIVDPGFEPEKIVAVVNRHRLTPVIILNTHGHVDHIAGNEAMKGAYPDAALVVGRGDAPLLSDPDLNLSGPFGMPIVSPPAERLLDEGDVVEAAGLRFDVLDLPGHSPGHVVFILRDDGRTIVIGGDVVFRDSIGRTDFPGGSLPQLLAGIRDKLWSLPDDAVIYPGHGPETTVGDEKRSNPYCSLNAIRHVL